MASLQMKLKAPKESNLLTEGALVSASTRLPKIVAKSMLYIGRAVFNNRGRFKRNSSPGLVDDFLQVPVVVRNGQVVVGSIGSDKPHARIQDEGGTIKPKRGRVLAIPARGGPAEALNAPSPRDFDGHWRPFAEGQNLGFFDNTSDQLLFVGVPQVQIQATSYFSDAWDDSAQTAMDMIGEDFWGEAFGGGK